MSTTEQIAERAMLVTLTISQWSGKCLDAAATQEVLDSHSAEKGSGLFNKMLVSKEALKPIQQAATAARQYLYLNTLPWTDSGERVLLNTAYQDFMEHMGALQRAFNTAVDTFLRTKYSQEVAKAAFRLNSLFDKADYPTEAQLARSYGFVVRVKPMPIADDFRVDIGADAQAALKAQIAEQFSTSVKEAMRCLTTDLAAGVQHLRNKLSTPDAIFHESTLEKLLELADRLPNLNLTQDPTLDVLRREIRDAFEGVTAKELRINKALRSEVVGSVDSILQKMAGAFGPV